MSERWLTVSEAATQLGCNKSSISRFLNKNTDVAVRRNGAGQVVAVEFTALQAARRSSLAVQDHAERVEAAQPVAAAPVAAVPVSSRRRAVQDEIAELDLAERKGELISRVAVFQAVETAGVALVQAMEQRRRALAQRLAGLNDVRAIEAELKAADRGALTALSAALREMSPVEPAAGGQAEAEAA